MNTSDDKLIKQLNDKISELKKKIEVTEKECQRLSGFTPDCNPIYIVEKLVEKMNNLKSKIKEPVAVIKPCPFCSCEKIDIKSIVEPFEFPIGIARCSNCGSFAQTNIFESDDDPYTVIDDWESKTILSWNSSVKRLEYREIER